MIRIDYTILRNEGDEQKIYKPDQIPNYLDNIVYIQGPNASGKSTLLNLIALAFYGHKLTNDDIDPSLREKISSLMDLGHQKLTFQISVDNPEMGITLISQKTNENSLDISVKKVIDGKETFLSYETFLRDFKLIYDIPHNPLERLPQLLGDVKVNQLAIGDRIEALRKHLLTLIEEIKKSRDPVKLANLKDKYNALEIEKIGLGREVKKLKIRAKKVIEFGFSKAYITYHEYLKEEQAKLLELKNLIEEANKEGRKRATDQARNLKKIRQNVDTCNSKYEEVLRALPPLVSKADQVHLKLWKESVLHDELYHPSVYKTLREKTQYFIDSISDKLEQEKLLHQNDLKAIELYRFLLSSLSNQKFNDVNLPGLNQTVEDFLKLISRELIANENLLIELNNLENCKRILQEFLSSLKTAIQTLDEYKDADKNSNSTVDLNNLTSQRTAVERRIKEYENILQYYANSLTQYGINPVKVWDVNERSLQDEEITECLTLSFEEILNKGNEINSLAKKKEETQNKICSAIEKTRTDISIMESTPSHEYQQYLQELEYYFSKVQNIERKFKIHYTNYINKIINGVDPGKLSDDEMKYIESVGKFLAAKIHSLRHINAEYEITNINMIKKKIYTNTNKEIRFSDLGTGQSQAAFLTAKLAMDESKKIIALFDEVAMMDEKSLKPVKEKIRELYISKKLFMAIIVQKGEVVKVESLL